MDNRQRQGTNLVERLVVQFERFIIVALLLVQEGKKPHAGCCVLVGVSEELDPQTVRLLGSLESLLWPSSTRSANKLLLAKSRWLDGPS